MWALSTHRTYLSFIVLEATWETPLLKFVQISIVESLVAPILYVFILIWLQQNIDFIKWYTTHHSISNIALKAHTGETFAHLSQSPSLGPWVIDFTTDNLSSITAANGSQYKVAACTNQPLPYLTVDLVLYVSNCLFIYFVFPNWPNPMTLSSPLLKVMLLRKIGFRATRLA